ncbi:hypothetical protein RUND412_008284 [Rhizina undulata]
MSRCKSLAQSFLIARPLRCLNASNAYFNQSSPLLPFLYPARSLKTPSANRSRPSRSTADDDDELNIPYETAENSEDVEEQIDPWSFLYEVKPEDTTSKYHLRGKLESHQGIPPGSSSITEREREIFSRIFESILSEGSNFSPKSKDPVRSFPSKSLNALFESAVGPQQSGNEITFGPRNAIDEASVTAAMAKASSIEEYPPSLRAAAARAAGLSRPNMTEKELLQEQERMKELAALMKQMRACNTDLELGKWMEDNVFSMVTKPSIDAKLNFPSANYADLVLEGMRILRKDFSDLAGVLSIFERIKRLGAESYVVGCSVGVYNQMIDTKWDGYRDLYKIKELVDEMEVNGIEGDENTVEILRKIGKDVELMNGGKKGQGAQYLMGDVDMALMGKLESYLRKLTNSIRIREQPMGGMKLGLNF